MLITEDLQTHLISRLPSLSGEFVCKNSGYEPPLAELLSMKVDRCRYWDARRHAEYYEFKKGKSIWLDLVRYSEQLLSGDTSSDASQPVRTLFFIPDAERKCIELIVCCSHDSLIDRLGLTKADARSLVRLREKLPRSLNAQVRLTVKDIRAIAEFEISPA